MDLNYLKVMTYIQLDWPKKTTSEYEIRTKLRFVSHQFPSHDLVDPNHSH